MMDIAVGTFLDRIIIIAYFAIVMGFGAYFGRYSKTTSDYFFGGRRFAWWLITISIVATGVGSHSFLKYSTKKLSTKNSIFLQENSIMLLVHPTKTSKKVKEESKIIFNVLKSYEQM